jgi:hypothetical protein
MINDHTWGNVLDDRRPRRSVSCLTRHRVETVALACNALTDRATASPTSPTHRINFSSTSGLLSPDPVGLAQRRGP